MEKFVIIALVLLFLIFFTNYQNVQEDFSKFKLVDRSDQLNNEDRSLLGSVITCAEKSEIEHYFGFPINKFITRINNFTNHTLDSDRLIEITFGRKIADFISKEQNVFFDRKQKCGKLMH